VRQRGGPLRHPPPAGAQNRWWQHGRNCRVKRRRVFLMNELNPRPRRAAERVWLHRSQWRTVAALLLLLAAVVISLATVAGFWWAFRARQPVIAGQPGEPPTVPVATMTLPPPLPSVVEVYPALMVHPRGPRLTVSSPGGTVAQVAVRTGQPVRAGQPLVRLEQPLPFSPPPVPRVANAAISSDRGARTHDRAETARLRQRVEELRSQIDQARLAAAAAGRPTGSVTRARLSVSQAEAAVERARQSLRAAAERRQRTDARYQSRLVSRFQFHLARSGELVAQVELREAEERASEASKALASVLAATDTGAAARAQEQIAPLEAEEHGIEARLARVSQRVAGARQQLPPPVTRPPVEAARRRAVAVQAPRAGIISTVWARTGETVPRGEPLLAITRPERPLLVARVGRNVRPNFSPGTRVTVQQRDGHTLMARVSRVQPEPDGSGLVEVVPPPKLRITDGAALVPPDVRPPAPTLPAAALQREKNETSVWIAVPRPDLPRGWIAHRQNVRAVAIGRNRVAVTAGLHPGDRVIVAGAEGLHENQPVAVVEVSTLRTGE
jgi:multidrug efflux pump subunit AcrA (membrane-fusion protein)